LTTSVKQHVTSGKMKTLDFEWITFISMVTWNLDSLSTQIHVPTSIYWLEN